MEALCSTSKHGILSPIILLIIGTGMCLCASQAQATPINLNVYDKTGSFNTSTLNVWVDVIDNGSSVDFVFHNDSTDGFIANIYIENTVFSSQYLSTGKISAASNRDVNFSDGGKPENPTGSIKNFGGNWDGNLFSAGAKTPSQNGIKPRESLTVRFDYIAAINFAELIAAMSDPAQFRIAEHIQGISTNNVSVWTTNTTVPQPATLMLLAAGLPFLRWRRA
jgi:hypothetical protein